MSDADVASVAGVPVAQACADLLELLAGVSDGRSARGRDHPAVLVVVLALVAAATVAGMTGYTAMAGWVADVPQSALTDSCIYGPVCCRPVGRRARRCGGYAPMQTLDTAIGPWTTARRSSLNPVAEAPPEPARRNLSDSILR